MRTDEPTVRRRRALSFSRQMMLLQVGILLVVVGLGAALEAWELQRTLDQRFQQQALEVSRTFAVQPGVGQEVLRRDRAALQRRATATQASTGALFVVVTDDRGIRLAHPDPAEVGRMVSTSPAEALSGRESVETERGSLGVSARGKVPVRGPDAAVVGEVSVGFEADDVTGALMGLLGRSALFLGIALLAGMGGTLLLTRLLKRRTFGLEPSDLAELVREQEAVLYGVSDGVIALDPDGVVTMANTEARRLLGPGLEAGTRLAELPGPEPLRRALGDRSGETSVTTVDERVLVVSRRPVRRDRHELGSVITILDRTELENLTGELNAIRLMTRALQAQRHEFANRLHTLHGLLHTAEPADAREYVDAVLGARDVRIADDSDAIAPATLRAFLAAKTSEAGELGVSLELGEDSRVPRKLAAPVEVVTVLGNLVNNAVEAAHEAPIRPARVIVDLLVDGADLVVSVANTGTGIEAGRQETLFAAGVTGRGPGRGLGLAIVRSTARVLGGDVALTHPGGDGDLTVFVARLPGVLRDRDPVPG